MDLKLKTTFDDTDLINGWKTFIEETKNASDSWEDFQKKLKDGSKTIGVDFKKNTDQAAAATKKFVREQKEASSSLKASAKDFKFFGISLNDLQEKYDALRSKSSLLSKALGSSAKGLTTSAKASRVLGIAMKAIPIFALVAAFTSIVAVFRKTQSGMDAISKATAGFNAVVGNAVDIAISYGRALIETGKAIFNIATFDFAAAKENAKNIKGEFQNIADEVSGTFEDVQKAVELEGASQKLRDNQIELRKEIANTRATIKELNLTVEDTTKSLTEREAAAAKSGELERGLLSKRIELEKENQRIIIEKNKLSESTSKDLEAEAEAVEAIGALNQESLELQTTINNKLNTIRNERIRKIEEEQARVQELQDAYQELYGDLEELSQEALLESLEPIQRLNEEQRIAVLELENFRNALLTAADAAGKDAEAIQDINDQVDNLVTKTKGKFQVEIDILTTQSAGVDEFDPLESLGEPEAFEIPVRVAPDIDESEIGKTFKDLQGEIYQEWLNESGGFKDRLQDIFGDDFDATLETFTGLGTTLLDNIAAGFQAELDQLQEVIDTRSESIDSLESDLEREKELRDLGLANNFESTKNALEQETALLEANVAKQQEIKKKQLKAQLASDLLTQGSALATSIANTFASNSTIPFGLGIVIALTQIASMIAAFKQFKTQVSSLYAGGRVSDALADRSSGQIAPMGKDDASPMNRGKAYRVVDNEGKDMKVELGGKEFFVNQADSLDQKAFLEQLNKGKFRGMDLLAELAAGPMSDTASITLQSTGLQAKTELIVNQQQLEIETLRQENVKLNTKMDELIGVMRNFEIPVFKPEGVDGEVINVKPSAFGSRRSAIRGRREV